MKNLKDKTTNIYIKFDTKEVFFINSVFESAERYAVFRTIDAKNGIGQLICSDFFIDEAKKTVEILQKKIEIEIVDEEYFLLNNIKDDNII
jgi:hypothetical protein